MTLFSFVPLLFWISVDFLSWYSKPVECNHRLEQAQPPFALTYTNQQPACNTNPKETEAKWKKKKTQHSTITCWYLTSLKPSQHPKEGTHLPNLLPPPQPWMSGHCLLTPSPPVIILLIPHSPHPMGPPSPYQLTSTCQPLPTYLHMPPPRPPTTPPSIFPPPHLVSLLVNLLTIP